MQLSQTPNWQPLEALHNSKLIDINDFMFMGSWEYPNGLTINTYKHRFTRLYFNISNDLIPYKLCNGVYYPIDITSAIAEAYDSQHSN